MPSPRPSVGSPRYAAGGVGLGRGAGPGLTHLIGVVAPSVVGDGARAPDDTTERRGELLQGGEAVGRADASATADNDRGGRQRDAGDPLDTVTHDGAGERFVEHRHELDRNGVRSPSPGRASTAWSASVSTFTSAASDVRSSREPPQRTRTSSHPAAPTSAPPAAPPSAPTSTSMTLATIGRSSRAAAWAITSLPRSVPVARTAVAEADRTSCATVSPHASGP